MRIQPSSHFLPIFLCILLFSTALSWAVPVVPAGRQKQVLVLYSARRDGALTIFGDRDLPRKIAAESKSDIDYYAEYLDVQRSPDPDYQNGFRDFLAVKYRTQRFDAVVAVQDGALAFV